MITLLKYLTVSILALSCIGHTRDNDVATLIKLEKQWLESEFSGDTKFISSILDSTFVCITEKELIYKKRNLENVLKNFNFREVNNIIIDSFKLEEIRIKIYSNTAVVTFEDYTYGRKNGIPLESKTFFYDVWIRNQGIWKAVSSQAHY